MIFFWLVCAVFVAIALAFVLPPLLQRMPKATETTDSSKEANVEVYRDQLVELQTDLTNGLISEEQYQQDRVEFERRLLEDIAMKEPNVGNKSGTTRNLAYIVALAIPVVAIIFYLRVGHPSAMSATPAPAGRSMAAPSASPADEGGFSQERIEANVAALAKRLEQNPNDVSGWIMLGRSYSSLEKYSEASAAFRKATQLKPDDADLLADYAFALAMVNGRKLVGEPTEVIKRALKIDPENAKALELAGSAAFEAGDYELAVKHWEKVLQKASDDPEISRALTERIEEAKSRLRK